jgi:putative membrane protein
MGKIRKAIVTSIAVALGTVAFVGCSRDEKALDRDNANLADINFARAAAIGNYTEIALGRLDTLGVDPDVKDFGAMMVADHSSWDSLLKSIAQPLGLSAPDSIDDAHAALKAQLLGLTGRAFDSVYIKNMVIDHQAAVDLYTAEKNNGQQYQLVLYAINQLPKLQEHLDKATVLAANY